LLHQILHHDPANRATVIIIQNHKWMLKVFPQNCSESSHQISSKKRKNSGQSTQLVKQPRQSTTSAKSVTN
ncbi:unnamed protein product, partial [Rotaria sordida]